MTIIILFEWNKSTQVLQGLGTVTMSLTYKRTMEIDGKLNLITYRNKWTGLHNLQYKTKKIVDYVMQPHYHVEYK